MLLVVLRWTVIVVMRKRRYHRTFQFLGDIMSVKYIRTNSKAPWHTFRESIRLSDIRHNRSSPYNSQGRGPLKPRCFDVRGLLVKAADGNENYRHDVTCLILWAEHVITQKSTGYSQCTGD